jgi:multiple sugar transport system permease protein
VRRSIQPLRYHRSVYLLLLPFLLGTLILVILPALLTIGLAFTEYDALSPPVWRGLANFHKIFTDQLFHTALRNSLFFLAFAVPLRVLGALLLALLFHQRRRGTGIYRVAVYLPTIIPDVAYALLWLWIFNPVYGPLNLALKSLGIAGPAWFTDPMNARFMFVIMALFQIGEGFVMLLAGLQNIPVDYYDAAAVDGATRWQQFRHISLPMLAPWLILLTIRDIAVSLQGTFTSAIIMTKGEPYYATLFLPMLIYDQTFDRFRFGIGAAMMVVMFMGFGILLWGGAMVLRSWNYTHDA